MYFRWFTSFDDAFDLLFMSLKR